MKSRAWLAVALLSISSVALAQGINETTDPAKIAAIEQHAQQLQSGGHAAPMMSEKGHMHKHPMRHLKGKAHKGAMKDKASADKPLANEGKS